METKLKPFDLKAALAGERVVRRDGEVVRIVEIPENKSHPVLVIRPVGIVYQVNAKGRYYSEADGRPARRCVADLFMAPKERTVYVNFYKDGSAFHHPTAVEAKLKSTLVPPDMRLAIAVPVTITE